MALVRVCDACDEIIRTPEQYEMKFGVFKEGEDTGKPARMKLELCPFCYTRIEKTLNLEIQEIRDGKPEHA